MKRQPRSKLPTSPLLLVMLIVSLSSLSEGTADESQTERSHQYSVSVNSAELNDFYIDDDESLGTNAYSLDEREAYEPKPSNQEDIERTGRKLIEADGSGMKSPHSSRKSKLPNSIDESGGVSVQVTDAAEPLFSLENFDTLDTRLLDSFIQPFNGEDVAEKRKKRKITIKPVGSLEEFSFSGVSFNFPDNSFINTRNPFERLRSRQKTTTRRTNSFKNVRRTSDKQDIKFDFGDTQQMMMLLKGMPAEFKVRFITLLLKSDRSGLADLVREMIDYHMGSGGMTDVINEDLIRLSQKKTDLRTQKTSRGKSFSAPNSQRTENSAEKIHSPTAHHATLMRNSGKKASSQTSNHFGKSTNGSSSTSIHSNRDLNSDRHQTLSQSQFVARQGQISDQSKNGANQVSTPVIESAIMLHKETFSEPGRIPSVNKHGSGNSRSIDNAASTHSISLTNNAPFPQQTTARASQFHRNRNFPTSSSLMTDRSSSMGSVRLGGNGRTIDKTSKKNNRFTPNFPSQRATPSTTQFQTNRIVPNTFRTSTNRSASTTSGRKRILSQQSTSHLRTNSLNNHEFSDLLAKIRHTPDFDRIMGNILSMLRAEQKLSQLEGNNKSNSAKSIDDNKDKINFPQDPENRMTSAIGVPLPSLDGSSSNSVAINSGNVEFDFQQPGLRQEEQSNVNFNFNEQLGVIAPPVPAHNIPQNFQNDGLTTIENRINNELRQASGSFLNNNFPTSGRPISDPLPIDITTQNDFQRDPFPIDTTTQNDFQQNPLPIDITSPNDFQRDFSETDRNTNLLNSQSNNQQFGLPISDPFPSTVGVTLPNFVQPSPVLSNFDGPTTIVPLSTDFDGQLHEDAIQSFKQRTRGSSTSSTNFQVTDDFRGIGDQINFVPLSTDFDGQFTDIPFTNQGTQQGIGNIPEPSGGVPLPGTDVLTRPTDDNDDFGLAIGDFAQQSSVGVPLPTLSSNQGNGPQPSSSSGFLTESPIGSTGDQRQFGIPLPNPEQTSGTSPITIADILQSERGSVNNNFASDADLGFNVGDQLSVDLGGASVNLGGALGVPLTDIFITQTPSDSVIDDDLSLDYGDDEIVDYDDYTSGDSLSQSGESFNIPEELDDLSIITGNTSSNLGEQPRSFGVPLPGISTSQFASSSIDSISQQGNLQFQQIQQPFLQSDLSTLNTGFQNNGQRLQSIGVPLPGQTFSQPEFSSINTNVLNTVDELDQVAFQAPTSVFFQTNTFGNQVGVPLPPLQNELTTIIGQNPIDLSNFEPQFFNTPGSIGTQNTANFGVSIPTATDPRLVQFSSPNTFVNQDNLNFNFQPSQTSPKFIVTADSYESFGIEDAGYVARQHLNSKQNASYHAAVDVAYPKHATNGKGHQYVTFLTPGLMFPFNERPLVHTNEQDSYKIPQPQQQYRQPALSYDRRGNSGQNRYQQIPSTTYTVPPPVPAPQQYLVPEPGTCQSRTVVMTTVLVQDRPASVTTLIERFKTVQYVNSYQVTPVTVVQTYSANTEVFHNTYELSSPQGQSTSPYTTPYIIDQTVNIGVPFIPGSQSPVARGGHYITNTKLFHTTILRTLTTQVPTTLYTTRHRISTIQYDKTVTTLRSTSVFCIEPGYSHDVDDSDEKEGRYDVHTQTPPLPYIAPQSPNTYRGLINPIVKASPGFKTDPASYRTWVGTLVDDSKVNGGSKGGAGLAVPSKFILLQHMWPKGFVLEDSTTGSSQLVQLSPGKTFAKRQIKHASDGDREKQIKSLVNNSRPPLIQSSLRHEA